MPPTQPPSTNINKRPNSMDPPRSLSPSNMSTFIAVAKRTGRRLLGRVASVYKEKEPTRYPYQRKGGLPDRASVAPTSCCCTQCAISAATALKASGPELRSWTDSRSVPLHAVWVDALWASALLPTCLLKA